MPDATDATDAKPDNSGPGYAKHPDYQVLLEPCQKRVRVMVGGECIADSIRVRMMHETKHLPVYYFPKADVRTELLTPTGTETACPFKGKASYWTIDAGGKTAGDAVWAYEAPFDEVPELADLMAFNWDRVDAWYEEDEKVFVHPRDPYSRIDVIASSRPVRVVLRGETVAETTDAQFLFETGLPVRYYIPEADMRTDLLEPSEKSSRCPYKGEADYFTARVGDQVFENSVWRYAEPLAAVAKIKGLLCFYNENVDAIFVDGAEQPRPATKWSK